MPFIQKTTQSGPVREIERYFASRNGKRLPRGANASETSDEQAEINDRHAQKRMWRLINANFDGRRGDIYTTLKEPPGTGEEEAKRAVGRFLRGLRAYRRKNGMEELKYILVNEKQGQWHHHIILNAVPLEVIAALWQGRGGMRIDPLDQTHDIKALAKYLTKKAKPSKNKPDVLNAKEPRRKYARRWIGSRNLAQPIITKKIITRETVMRKLPAAPKGYRLLPDWQYGADALGYLYMAFTCVRLEDERPAPVKARGKPGKKVRA